MRTLTLVFNTGLHRIIPASESGRVLDNLALVQAEAQRVHRSATGRPVLLEWSASTDSYGMNHDDTHRYLDHIDHNPHTNVDTYRCMTCGEAVRRERSTEVTS